MARVMLCNMAEEGNFTLEESTMSLSRRNFLSGAATGGAVSLATLAAPAIAQSLPAIKWRLASSYPKSLDTVFGGADIFSKKVAALTGGRFTIQVFAAGEIVPGLQVADAVQNGTVEMGHTNSYYYIGKNKAFAFETTVPFGLNTRIQNAWMIYGGGNQLVQDFLRDYSIVSFPGGNTGCQMGGWFRKEVRTVKDLSGLKIRIAGLGGEVFARLGAVPQQIAGGDIYPALEKGTIDAAEWVGPYDDEKLGFFKVAKNFYYPGWWEPNSQFSFYINSKEWDKLPKEYQAAVEQAALAVNQDMMAEYDAKNPNALKRLIANGVKLLPYSSEILRAAQDASYSIYDDEAAKNPAFKKMYVSWLKFREDQFAWQRVAEHTMANFLFNNKAPFKTSLT
jgi:TRAP-type mannitol/chloroaromatic compound transport system substrate-binding protein